MAHRRRRYPAKRKRPRRPDAPRRDSGPQIAFTRPGSLKPSPTEATMVQVARLLARKSFSSMAGAQAYLDEQLGGGSLPAPPPTSPRERAHDLTYRAWEAPAAERADLAGQALALDPDCTDALVILALQEPDASAARARWREAVAAGERSLGDQSRPSELRRSAWKDQATRPYLRARLGLALHERAQGDAEAALAGFRALLDLNADDNQGVRYLLAAELLRAGRHRDVERLLDRFGAEGRADWPYHRLLLALRRGAGAATCQRLLDAAVRCNPLAPEYLLGRTPVPDPLPEAVVAGGREEAAIYAALAGEAWRTTPGALAWLQQQLWPATQDDQRAGRTEGPGRPGDSEGPRP